MKNEFSEIMSSHSDLEIFKIINLNSNDYTKEALNAAKKEFINRNLSNEDIHEIEIDIEQLKENEFNVNQETLESWQKVLFFIFFWGVIPWSIAGTFKNAGYMKKYTQAWKYMRYGFLTFCIFLGAIIFVLWLTL